MGEETRLGEHPVRGVEKLGRTVLVHLVGELDLHNAREVRTTLLELCTEQPERLVIDLDDVDFVDSTVLGVLVEARTALDDRQALLLASPRPAARRALAVSGLDRHLLVHETVESALGSPVG